MAKAIAVRVVTDITVQGERATALWIVATSDPDRAAEIVRARVPATNIVEATEWAVPDEVVEQYKLAPDQAWHI